MEIESKMDGDRMVEYVGQCAAGLAELSSGPGICFTTPKEEQAQPFTNHNSMYAKAA